MSMHPHEHEYTKSLFENPGRLLTSVCPRKTQIRLMIVIASMDNTYVQEYTYIDTYIVYIYIYIYK